MNNLKPWQGVLHDGTVYDKEIAEALRNSGEPCFGMVTSTFIGSVLGKHDARDEAQAERECGE